VGSTSQKKTIRSSPPGGQTYRGWGGPFENANILLQSIKTMGKKSQVKRGVKGLCGWRFLVYGVGEKISCLG